MEEDAISDMNLEHLRKSIVISICVIWLLWPIRITMFCLTVNKVLTAVKKSVNQELVELTHSMRVVLSKRQVIRHLISKVSPEN